MQLNSIHPRRIAQLTAINVRKRFQLYAVSSALLAVLCGMALPEARADVRLPAILSSGMVLQRDIPVPIWGSAAAGEKVTVEFAGQSHTTQADEKGHWQVTLNPLAVGPARQLVVAGRNRVVLDDVLVGEVWLCSGQSNMQWPVRAASNADLTSATARYPEIRLISVATPGTQTPLDDFVGQWEACSPESVPDFSAVGYHFGRTLHEMLEVPIGLVDNSWGGSACEAWVPRERLAGDPLYEPLLARWQEFEAADDSEAAWTEYYAQLVDYRRQVRDALAAGRRPTEPPFPRHRLLGNHRPGNLFNGRVKPVMPYAIRGTIWYQGESNAGRAYQYRELFPLMIGSWRDQWQQGDFPFYWVQLADFGEETTGSKDSGWAELREAQTMTLERLPNTGEAVIIDIGEGNDIHPRNKEEVGRRLARLALAQDYGVDIEHQSPRLQSAAAEDGKMVVTLSPVGGRLRSHDANEVRGFALAGEDQVWHQAEASIVGQNRVEVTSEAVPQPVAVRYAWGDNPVANLVTTGGLPVTPFRSDDWPGVTAEAR